MTHSQLAPLLVAAGAIAVGALVGFGQPVPGREYVAAITVDWIVFAGAALALTLALAALYDGDPVSGPKHRERSVDTNAEGESAPAVVGELLERELSPPSLARSGDSDVDEAYERERVRQSVREALIGLLAERDGVVCNRHDDRLDPYRELVRDGRWTDDPRAGAYLSRDVDPPLRTRLDDWLRGRTHLRRLRAAIDELERVERDVIGPNRGRKPPAEARRSVGAIDRVGTSFDDAGGAAADGEADRGSVDDAAERREVLS